jgi:tetratricopeptide (TPR) repeat protein
MPMPQLMTLSSNFSSADFDCPDGDNATVEYDWQEVIEHTEANAPTRAASATAAVEAAVTTSPLEDRVEIEGDRKLEIAYTKLEIAYNECAHSNYPIHDYPAALAVINLAIEHDPERVNLYYQRALIAKALHDYPQVLADCKQILQLDANHRAARGLNAIALVRTQDYKTALIDFDRHIELYPEDPHGYCYRGICYEQLKEHTHALADFNTALELKPGEPIFHHARGRTYQQLGNFSAALADYDLVIEQKPLLAAVYDDRAEIYRLQGDYAQAIVDCTQSILLNPERIDAYFRRGIVRSELGELDLALADYDRIISILPARGPTNDPYQVRTYVQRSWLYFRQGKYSQAAQDCESIFFIDRFCFWANYLLGVINAQTGFKYRAIGNFSKAIEISPHYVSARYHRGVIYHELGNINEANNDFTQARAIQDMGLEKLIDRDETGFYAEGLALYYTGQIDSAIVMLKLSLLVTKRFSNSGFQAQVLQLLQHFADRVK